ncbi:MAG: FHA domain-containing protein [Planctomycetaceae bacterium]
MEQRTTFGDLVPCGGGDPIPLLKTSLLIGRRRSCDISLRFPNVSSHHCQLELINGYWHLRDLGSRNGVKVNGVRCDQKWLLPGDELSIARHRYEIAYHPDGDEPPPLEADPFALSLLEKAGLSRRPDVHRTRRSSSFNIPRKAVTGNAPEEEVSDWLADEDDLD